MSYTEFSSFLLASCFILFKPAIALDSSPSMPTWNCTSTNDSCGIIQDVDDDEGIQRNTNLVRVLVPIIAMLVIVVTIVILALKFCKRNRMTTVMRRMPATRRRHPDPGNSTGLYTLQQSELSQGETDLYVYTASTHSYISTLGYSTNLTPVPERSSFGTDKYDYVEHVVGNDRGKVSYAMSKNKNNVSDCPPVSVKSLSRLFESNECHVTHKISARESRHFKGNLPHVTDQAVIRESRHLVNTTGEPHHITDPAKEEPGNTTATSPCDDPPVYATEISKLQVSPQEDLNPYEYAASTDSQVFSMAHSTDNTSITSRLSSGTDKYIYIEVDEGVEVSNANTRLKDDVSDCPSGSVKCLSPSHHFESMEGSLNYVTDLAAERKSTTFESDLRHVPNSAEKHINDNHYGTLASLSDENFYDALSHNQK